MKEYIVKLYDGATYKRTIPNAILQAPPSFASRINGGLGELTVDLKLPPEDFGYQDTIDFGFILDVYAVTGTYPEGKRIYRGTIEEIEAYSKGKTQGVVLKPLGAASTLTFDYFKSGSSYTVSKTDTPGEIVKDIIDHHQSVESKYLVTYTGSSIDVTGDAIEYEFNDQKWSECIEKMREQAGGYWYVDADAVLHFKQKPATATHSFILGTDVSQYEASKSSKGVVNVVQVRWDGGTTDDSTAASITTYRRRGKVISDTNIKSSVGGGKRADTELAENDEATQKTRLTITSEYNIENIHPGETCKILNIESGQTFFGDNMQIVGMRYDGNRAVLDLEELTDFGEALSEFVSG